METHIQQWLDQEGKAVTGVVRLICASLAAVIHLTVDAHAGPDRVSILTQSEHIGFRFDGFNEKNLGVILTWENALGRDLDVNLGAYKNSYARGSVMASVSWTPIDVGQCEFGAFAGVVNYPIEGRHQPVSIGGTDLIAMAGLQARCGNFFINAMPASPDMSRGIVAAGITMEIGK